MIPVIALALGSLSAVSSIGMALADPPAPSSTRPAETAKEPSLKNSTGNNAKSDKQKDNQSKQRNSGLASTGANVIMILSLAGLLILAGIVIMMLRRRKP